MTFACVEEEWAKEGGPDSTDDLEIMVYADWLEEQGHMKAAEDVRWLLGTRYRPQYWRRGEFDQPPHHDHTWDWYTDYDEPTNERHRLPEYLYMKLEPSLIRWSKGQPFHESETFCHAASALRHAWERLAKDDP